MLHTYILYQRMSVPRLHHTYQCLNFAIKSYSIKNNIQFTVFENIFLIFIDELCIIVYGGKIVTFHMGNRISLYITAIANVYESGNI